MSQYPNPFITSQPSTSKLQATLSQLKSAQSVILNDQYFGDEGCKQVASYIQQNLNLQSLELKGKLSITRQ